MGKKWRAWRDYSLRSPCGPLPKATLSRFARLEPQSGVSPSAQDKSEYLITAVGGEVKIGLKKWRPGVYRKESIVV